MSEPALIGEAVVSPETRLKVRLGRRGGRDLVDLRLFRQGEGIGAFDQATKQGGRAADGISASADRASASSGAARAVRVSGC